MRALCTPFAWLWSLVLRALGRPGAPTLRLRPASARALIVDARAARVERAAKRERVPAEELEDSIQLLAARYPITADDVLAVIERHGLAQAQAHIEQAVRDEP